MTQPQFEPNETSEGSVAEEAADPTAQQAPEVDGTAPSGDEAAGTDSGDNAEADAQDAETPEQSLQRQLDERTADLQRLQAEYVNYRRRVERDRASSRNQGKVDVLKSLLTVLDDLGRAEQHGELVGGFKAVSDQIWNVVRGHQLESFGQIGDVFDARFHEALYNTGTSPDVGETSIAQVVKTGYRVGDEIIRHAEVGVVEPEPAAETPADAGTADTGPTDDGLIDGGPADDSPIDDGPADDGPVDDSTVEDGPKRDEQAS